MYVVTFEERMLVNNNYEWVQCGRTFDDLVSLKDFLEVMYSSSDGDFGNVQICHIDKLIAHAKKITVEFDL